MALISRLFSIGPRIRDDGDRLIATTAWRYRLLTLGASDREVIIDPTRAVVVIRRRSLWVFRRRTVIPFSSVKGVTYGYDPWSPDSWWSWTYDGFDIDSVGLSLHDGGDVHLFNFFGEGAFANDGPLPDWMYWGDSALDCVGTQDAESRAYAERLSRAIGVRVAPPSWG
jgi:hypothetical protein